MPKIVQIGMGGSDVASPPTELTTNLDPALLFEDGTTGEDFIEVDTTTNANKLVFLGSFTEADNESSGLVGVREATPKAPLHIVGTGGSTGMSIDPTANSSPALFIENSSSNSKDRCLVALNADGSNGSQIRLHQADTNRLEFAGTGSTANVSALTVPLKLSASSGSGQYISFTTGGAESMRIDNDNKVGIGEDAPLCASPGLHVKSGDSGHTQVHADWNDIVVESDGRSGITLMSKSTDPYSGIAFTDAGNAQAGLLRYDHSLDNMEIISAGNGTIVLSNATGRMKIRGAEDTTVNAMFEVVGNSDTQASGTFGTGGASSTTLVRSGNTPGEICAGASIKVGSDTRTITAIAANGTDLTVDSAVTVADGTNGFIDPPLLQLRTAKDAVALEFTNKRQLVCADTRLNVTIGTATCMDSGTSVENNVIVGANAGTALTTGAQNTILGRAAGDVLTTGTNNVIIGNNADPSANSGTNQVIVGEGTTGTANNQVRLGNSSISSFHCQTSLTVDSDERIKTEVTTSQLGLDFVNALRPVTYKKIHPADWPEEIRDARFAGDEPAERGEFDSDAIQHGLIAQEVETALGALPEGFSGHVIEPSGKQGIQYERLVMPLIKAVQELTARIEVLENGD